MAKKSIKKTNHRKENREMVSNIVMFLMESEKFQGLVWHIKTVKHDRQNKIISIGVNTTEKMGTVLSKMRSLAKDLSNHLFEVGLTNVRQTKVKFFVDREDLELEKVYNLIDDIKKEAEPKN